MFVQLFRREGTVIAEGLKIVGSVTAEGLVEVNGRIEGDLYCTSLIVAPKAHITGGIQAERVVVDGRVEGPIQGGEVLLKSHAYVVGDILHRTLAIESGAHFDGQSLHAAAEPARVKPDRIATTPQRQPAVNGREAAPAAA